MTFEKSKKLKEGLKGLKNSIEDLEQSLESCEQKEKVCIENHRCYWAILYLLLGLIFLILFFLLSPDSQKLWNEFYLKKWEIIWCMGWTSIGIGLGLYNDRNKSYPLIHYFTYFIFVLFIGTLAGFIAFQVGNYAAAALAAIVIGFVGDGLAGAILKLSNQN